ncbi:hypothetical protein BN2476_100079 [Paraburkholderia piptadeniae]|uniref:Uncharacterized protein n=1 Tax=Paraburkholderia piptadeniae TaxID=1701573 RepID=A0A1N7RPY0_9BURK|nr:hypothetical protein BN2476_100079 [Paraburkholderia piptadeniae]
MHARYLSDQSGILRAVRYNGTGPGPSIAKFYWQSPAVCSSIQALDY